MSPVPFAFSGDFMRLRINSFISIGYLSVAVLFDTGCSSGPQSYVDKGNKFFEAHKYDDATIQYRKAIQKDPNFGEAYYRLGLVEMERDRGAAAYEPLFRAVQLMPQNETAKIRLADVTLALLVAGQYRSRALYEQIDKLADQLLEKNRNSFDGLRLKGSLRLLDRHPKDAIALFEQANRIQPMRPDLVEIWVQALFQERRIDEGERLARELIARDKTFRAIYDVLYRQYISAGRAADAENILKTKIANNPNDANSLLQLARYYASAQNPSAMNSALERILSAPKNFPDARLQVGNFYASLGQWDQAFRQFEEGSRSSSPSNQKKTSGQEIDRLGYQKRMADSLLAQGKKDEARQLVDMILKDAPKDEDARRIRASLLLDAGGAENVTAAVAELKALMGVTQSQSNDIRLRSLLGRAYMASGEFAAARNEFQQVIGLRKDDIPSRFALAGISLNEGKQDEAVRYADEILAIDATNGAASLLKATAMTDAGYYGSARSELRKLQRDYPKSREVQFQFGLLAVAEKQYGEAETIFRKLNEAGAGDKSSVVGLVSVYSAQNRWDRAIDLLNEDLKKSPGSAAIRQLMATTAARAGKYDLAATEYQNLLAKHPKSIALRIQLGEVYRLKGDLNNAIAVLQPARALAPKDPNPVMLVASFLQKAGRYKEALGEYQHVLELRPDHPFVLNNIAFLLAESGGNLDEALRYAQRALEKSPGHPILIDTLGWIYLKRGNHDSAAQTFSNLVRQEPKNPAYRYHYAMALLEKGDRQAAKREVQSALAAQPDPDMEQKIKALASRIG